MAHRNYFRQNNLLILKLARYTKITILGANWHFSDWKGLPNVYILFCLQKKKNQVLMINNKKKKKIIIIKKKKIVMKIKKFMLPI